MPTGAGRAAPSRCSAQVFVEEGDGPVPCQAGLLRVVGADQVLVVVEGVPGRVAVAPPYGSGARVTKPSAARRSAMPAMWSVRPHHSWMTTTPAPWPEGGVARYP